MANEGIELEIYSYTDPTVKIGSVFGRQSPEVLDQINDLGAGSFKVAKRDKHLVKKPQLLDSRNVCKVRVDGVITQAFLIRDKINTPVNEAGESSIQVSGPGLKEWFDDAELYPFHTLRPYSSSARYFNFASEMGSWYSNYDWIDPTPLFRVKSPGNTWEKNPDKWPGGAEQARWIWVEPYSPDASTIPCYFRYTIELATSGTYSIYSAADDQYELYVDGEFIARSDEKSSALSEASRVELELAAGTHVIGYKAWNFTTANGSPRGPAGLLMAMFKVSNASKETLVGRSGAAGWKCLAYPTEAPGWTLGEVLISLLNEAEARGVRSMGWLNPNFTAANDSYGTPWAERKEWYWDIGTPYSKLIMELEDTYDVWINPSNLQLNVVPERGVDRTVVIGSKPPVEFKLGRDVISTEVQTRGKIKNALLISTDDGWVERTAGSTSMNKYGRIEGSMSVPGSGAGATTVAQMIFKQRAEAEEGASYKLLMNRWTPMVDFNVGDWVLAPNSSGQSVSRRVMSISVTEDDAGNPVWTIEFDTIFQNNDEKINRIITKLGGGGAASGSGSATGIRPGNSSVVTFPPSVPGIGQQDEVPPPAPSKPILTTRLGVVTVEWNGKDLNGEAMPPDFDWVEVMRGPAPGISSGFLQAGAGSNFTHITDLPYNTPVTVWLRAIDIAGNISPDSETATISTQPLVDTDLIGKIIDGVNIKLETITAELIADQAINEQKLADNAVSLGKLDSITRDMIEQASEDASSSNGRVTTSQNAPTPTDGVGKPIGGLWFRYDAAGTLIGTWLWDGTQWDPQQWGSEAIGDGAITQDKLDQIIQDGITDAIADSETALIAANGKNRITHSHLVASGTNDGAGYNYVEGDSWFRTISGMIVGQWTFRSGVWEETLITDLVIGNLDAGKITTGFLDAARINVNTITAEKMVLANLENLIPNGAFSKGLLGWSSSGTLTAETVTGINGGPTQVVRYAPTAADQGIASSAFPFSGETGTPYTPGATYAFRLVARVVSGNVGEIRIRLGLHGIGQTNSWIVVPGTTLQATGVVIGSGWVTLTGTYTTPADSRRDKMSIAVHSLNAAGSVFEIAEVSARIMADASLVVDGSITAQKMVTGTITAASGIIGAAAIGTAEIANAAITNAKIASLDAGKITSGYIDAARINANTITARMIAIGDFENVAGSWDEISPPWTLGASMSILTSSASAHTGSKYLLIDGTLSGTSTLLNRPNTSQGDEWYVEFWAFRNSSWNGTASNSKVRLGDQANSIVGAVSYGAESFPANVWTKISGVVTINSADVSGLVITLGNDATAGAMRLDDLIIRKRSKGELLVDGAITSRTIATGAVTANEIASRTITASRIASNAITANEIAALTITGNEIAANTITGAKIAALTVTAGEIAANAITADKINAGAITAVKIATDAITSTKIDADAITSKHTITGATFQTSATTARGIKINSGGLSAYDGAGVERVRIASTGAATFSGTVRNNASGPRVEISSSDDRGIVWFYSGTAGSSPANISSDPAGEGLLLYGGKLSGGIRFSTLQLYEQGANLTAAWALGQVNGSGTWEGARVYSTTNTDLLLARSSGHRVYLIGSGTNDGYTQLVGNGVQIFGSLSTTGTKNFRMDHPTKPDKSLVHASTESPMNGVEYWSDGLVEMPLQGFKTVTLPAYFEALTAPDHRVTILTPGSADANLWAEPVANGKVIIHGTPGALFSWLVKARRVQMVDGEDQLAFVVEDDKMIAEEATDPSGGAPNQNEGAPI